MLSVRNILLAAAAAFATVRADYVIDPDSVPLSQRTSWCQSEISTCPLICQQSSPGTTLTNTCDPKTLTYGCICGTGLQPNISEYSLTLPYFVCQEWGNQCVSMCGTDSLCASDCRQNHPCGAQNPTRVNVTSSSSMASTTGSATGTATGDATTTTANQIFTGLASTPTSSSTTTTKNGAGSLAEGPAAILSSAVFGLFILGGALVL